MPLVLGDMIGPRLDLLSCLARVLITEDMN